MLIEDAFRQPKKEGTLIKNEYPKCIKFGNVNKQ
jgi:hypothetical protein